MNSIRGILCFLILLVCSCSDDEDRLTNKWQLRQYEYADGTVKNVDNIFYNFQKGTFSAICLISDGQYQTFFGNYELNGEQLSVVLLPEHATGEIYEEYLNWENGSRIFKVDKLSSSILRLEYENTILNFRKY